MFVILFAVFIDLLGFGIIVPILPFLTMELGGDPLMGTILISTYSLVAFLAGPFWGRMSDRVGRKPVLTATLLVATISYVVLGLSETLLMLFIARAMSGASAGNIGIIMAAAADLTDEKTRGKVMGQVGAAFALGFAFGPGIGGVLSSIGGEGDIFYAGITAAGLSFLAMILTAFFMPETNEHRTNTNQESTQPDNAQNPHWTHMFKSTKNLLLMSMFILTAIAQSISFSIAPFWVNSILGWDIRMVGYTMMGAGLFIFFLQMFAIDPMFRLVGEIKTLATGVCLSLVGCILLIAGPATSFVAIVGLPLSMGGLTLTFPALNSIISRRTSKQMQGAALGTANGFSALGRIAGPITAGSVFTANTDAPYHIMIATGLLILLWCVYELDSNKTLDKTDDDLGKKVMP